MVQVVTTLEVDLGEEVRIEDQDPQIESQDLDLEVHTTIKETVLAVVQDIGVLPEE